MNRTRTIFALATAATLLAATPAAAQSPIQPVGDVATPALPPEPPDLGVIAPGDQPTIEVIHVETDTTFGDIGEQGTVLIAETLADTASDAPGWWMRLDVRVRNTGAAPVEVTSLGVTTDVSGLELLAVDPTIVEPGLTNTFKVTDVTGLGTPPAWFTVNIYATGAAFPAQATYDVDVYDNATPTGGYRFPARAENLPTGAFWSIGGFHSHSVSQRYAYDFGVVRWDAELQDWTGYTEQAYIDDSNGIPLGSRDEHFLVFGQPVYSMSDGVVVKCRRSFEDQDPPLGDTTASNTIAIAHDNGEVASYTHLQELSMPAELCPVETPAGGVAPGHVAIAVHAGDFLGYAGSSGDDSPHLHVQLQDAGYDTPSHRIRGLPLNFHDVHVRQRVGFDPTTDTPDWNWVTWPEAATIGPKQLVHPNSCGWDTDPGAIDDIAVGRTKEPSRNSLPAVTRCDVDPLAGDPVVAIPVNPGGGYSTEPKQPTAATLDPEYKYVPVRRTQG